MWIVMGWWHIFGFVTSGGVEGVCLLELGGDVMEGD
jgi:hypothetical protein